MMKHVILVALLMSLSCFAQDSSTAQPQASQAPPSSDSKKRSDRRGKVYLVGGGVSAPRAVDTPDPEYTEGARKAKRHGIVVLWLVVGDDGIPRDIKVSRSAGSRDLDEKAVEAVRKWRFQPAMKAGKPVAVQINVEINFKLY